MSCGRTRRLAALKRCVAPKWRCLSLRTRRNSRIQCSGHHSSLPAKVVPGAEPSDLPLPSEVQENVDQSHPPSEKGLKELPGELFSYLVRYRAPDTSIEA